MTSSWLASFVLIVAFLGVMAVISGGAWLLFLGLSRFGTWRTSR
jgi:Na+/pantothenate symporter